MTHLDEERLADAIEGRMAAADAAHLDDCVTCRTLLQEMRGVLEHVVNVEVPAPSPLFWAHFRTRVSHAIEASGSPRASWFAKSGFRWLTAMSAAVTMVLIALTLSVDPQPSNDPDVSVRSSIPSISEPDDLDQDEAWALVRSLAEDLDLESAHEAGVSPAPGAVERAAEELSAAERTALIQLLEQEMKRTDS